MINLDKYRLPSADLDATAKFKQGATAIFKRMTLENHQGLNKEFRALCSGLHANDKRVAEQMWWDMILKLKSAPKRRPPTKSTLEQT